MMGIWLKQQRLHRQQACRQASRENYAKTHLRHNPKSSVHPVVENDFRVFTKLQKSI